jgi:outer membrane immunogenic protein
VLVDSHDWSGFYIGATAGYSGTDVAGRYDSDNGGNTSFLGADEGGPLKFKINGLTGGLETGYNWQHESLVLGIEGDANFVDWSDGITNDGNERVSAKTNFVGTLRGRAGYAIDTVLLYGTAGLSLSHTKYTANDNVTTGTDIGSMRLNGIGFVAGGGVEFAVNENWSLKGEGLYFFDGKKKSAGSLTTDSDSDDFAQLKNGYIIRAGINYKF